MVWDSPSHPLPYRDRWLVGDRTASGVRASLAQKQSYSRDEAQTWGLLGRYKIKDFPEKAQDIFIEAHLCLNKYVNSLSYTRYVLSTYYSRHRSFFFLQVRVLEWEMFLCGKLEPGAVLDSSHCFCEFSPFGLAQLHWQVLRLC